MHSLRQIKSRTMARASTGLGATVLAGVLATTLSLAGASAVTTGAHHDAS
jgi:hypothetical protein